jgi:DNA polymerase/3'-5' exonuclease PolX
MSDKPKFPRADALDVTRIILGFIGPFCDRLIVAGSLRRRKPQVGDIEILYIPKTCIEPDGLFDEKQVNLVDSELDRMLAVRTISKRLSSRGSESWGGMNKLAVHTTSQIPVDFFRATRANWFNYLVCRTGSAENNTRIASAAQTKGWKWHPYGIGFTDSNGNWVRVESEADVFRLVGLPYREPWDR